MHWMLALRRVRRSLKLWRESKQVCTMCGRPVERFEFVCEEEACQLGALCGQALLASAQEDASPNVGRIVRSKRDGSPAGAIGLGACA